MADINTDPRQIGVGGLEGLRGINSDYTPLSRAEQIRLSNKAAFEGGTSGIVNPVGLDYEGVGNSKYDRRVQNIAELENIGDFRANEESSILKLANGLAKGVVLAGTTFLDGTVGLATGLGTAISEGRFSGLWDNSFSRAMKAVNDTMEEALPNYYTQDEINNPLALRNIFSSNFLGDKLIKNLGFTVGAYYSGALFTKPLSLISAISKSGIGAAVASGVGATMSAINEGRIEALNNSTDWYNLEKAKLDNTYNTELSKYQGLEGTAVFNEVKTKLDTDYINKLQELETNKTKVGNADMLFNLPILLASNIVQFGKLYARGFSTAQKGYNIVGKPGSFLADYTKLGKAGVGIKAATSEGTEEVLQQLAANVSGFKYKPEEYNLSINQAGIDTDAEEQTVSWMKAFATGLNETVNDASTWEQFIIGAFTGALGMPTFGRANNAEAWLGKNKPIGLTGGAVQAIKDYNTEREEAEALVNRLNERVQSPEFLNYYRGLIRHNKFQNDMNRAAEEGKAREFKDAEYAQMISDISMFAKAGKLNDYRDLISSAFDTSDENLQAIIEGTTSKQTAQDGTEVTFGPFIDTNGNPMTSSEEGKAEMIKKISEAKDEMLKAADNYAKINERISTEFGSRISDSQREELVWYSLLSKNQRDRALSIATQVKPYIEAIAQTMTTEIENLELQSAMANEPLVGAAKSDYDILVKNRSTLLNIASSSPEVIATALANNKPFALLVKDRIEDEIISEGFDKFADDVKQDIDDIRTLINDSVKYENKVKEFLKNPEKIAESQNKERKKEETKVKTKQKVKIEDKLASATSFSDIKNILADETTDASTKDKALRASTNQVAKDYNKLLQSVKATRVKAAQLSDQQLKSDINKILDNLVDNANTTADLDPEGVLIADPEILRASNTDDVNNLFVRSQKAIQVIKSTFGETLKTNEGPIIEITEPDDNAPIPPDSDLEDEEFTTGNQKVPVSKTVNPPASQKEEIKTAVIDGVEVSVDENNNVDTYLSKEETGAIPQNIEAKSKEETRDIQEDTGEEEKDEKVLIYPSSSQYDLTGMNPFVYTAKRKYATDKNGRRISKDIEFNKVNKLAESSHTYLSKNGPEGNAFEWINKGGLQQYLQNKGKLYVGIDSRSGSELAPVIFIKNQDNTYSPIAILWESDDMIKSFVGLREITDKVREEYQSNKVENAPYVSPNIEIPAENVNITSGRVAYTNNTKHLVKDAIEGSEISSDNADILVIADGNLVGGTGKVKDYRISGSGNSGMAYISIPNARRGGFKGNTLVPIIPKRYSEVRDSNESFVTNVKATIQKLAESLSNGDIDTYKADLKKLGDYLTLSYLAVGYQKDEDGNVVRFFFKQIERNPDGSVVKVERNGKEVVKSDPISSVAVGASVEEISAAIENALIQLQVPIRVNKNFVKDKRYNQKLIEQGLVETYATRLKSEAAYFTFTAPTVQQKPVETTTESKKEVKPTESNASDDLFDLDNFGVSDVLTKKMVGSTVPIEPTSESLSRYGLELNKEYSAYDIIKALKEVSSPISSKVVDLLMRAAREMGIKYTIEKGNGTDFGASRGNQISIYTDPSDSKFTHVVLHETIHSFTSWLLNPENSPKLTSSEKQTVAEIQKLFELARENGVTNDFNASTSIDEFVSELANPEFANQLSRIKVEEKKSLLGRLKEKIKELINKFLGRSYEKQYSNVKDELEKLLEQAVSYREVYDSEFLMSNYTREELEILRNAPRDNEGHLLAPNGKPTNLTEKQYAQVRTKAFKDWFGDWESIAPKVENGNDSVGGSPVALSYLLEGGPSTIESTGYLIHGISAAFELITYEIESVRSKYLGQIDATPSNFINDNTGALQEIKELIDKTYGQQGLNILNDILNNATGFYAKEGNKVQNRLDELNNTIRNAKSKNVSKVVDENGEPLVVYHGNKYSAPITEFKEGFKNTFNTAKKGYYFTDNIEDAKYFSDTEGYSEIAKEQKKYLDNVTNNYKVIYNIENSGKDVIEFYDTDWGPLYVPLKSNNKTSIIKAIKESKEYKQALNDYNRYLEFANSNGQILSVFLNIRDTKNIRDYNITGLGAHQYIAQSPNQIKSATDNNGEFSRTNNNIYYMRPQPKYLGSPQEISNIIDSYRNTYSINREVVQNAVNRINEAAGKTIAKLGRGSLHEGIQAYKVDIIEEPTLDTLWKAHSNSLLEYSKQEVGEPMTEFEKEELINLGYSEDWIETATRDEINYARVCAGV